jgi:hypothetical protein
VFGGEGEAEECAVLTPSGKDDRLWVGFMALVEYIVQGNLRVRTIRFVVFVQLRILVMPFAEIDSYSW